jgi:coenzyme F420-0:L-glutamate ligase / coenzyme F420-1:gamma-L-glutamate ligase
MSDAGTLSVIPLHDIPEVEQHHDLGRLLRNALDRAGVTVQTGDVLVVSGKLVSKAWGLRTDATDRDAVVLAQSRRVVAERRSPSGTTRVVEALAGPVLAAAGVDASNTGPRGGLLLLPDDPDLAARALYAGLLHAYAPAPLPEIGVVVSDTAGRPWREGQVDFALGACGVAVLDDLRGGEDVDGRPLRVTSRAVADEIAAAADLVKGKSAAVPAALVRGLPEGTVTRPGAPGAAHLVRTGPGDWFGLGRVEAVRSALGAPPGSAAATQVGIASVLPEPETDRVSRAVALAMLGSDGRAEVEDTGTVLCIRCADPYERGRLAARLEVALHSETVERRVEVTA